MGLTRRGVVGALTALPLVTAGRAAVAGPVVQAFDEVVAPDARVRTVFAGGMWCEGPCWAPGLGGLVFSDTRGSVVRVLAPDGIAVDLANGRVVRRLDGHWSTGSSEGVVKFVEHRPVLRDAGGGPPQPPEGGANGIALSPDGGTLYYAPLMGRNLYAVPTEALLDENAPDALVAAKGADLGEKGMTGGLGCDAKGRVYLTLQEQNAIGRRDPDGTIEVIGSDPRLIWADTIVITGDEWLYVSAAQANRRPEYNRGQDEQAPPYAVLRLKIDAGPAWPKAM